MRRPHKQIKNIVSINEESHPSVFDSDVAAAAIAAATAQEANKSSVSRKRSRMEDQVEEDDEDDEEEQENSVDREQLQGQIREIDGEAEERDNDEDEDGEDDEEDNNDEEDDEDNASVNNNVIDQMSDVPTTSGLQEQVNQVVAQVQASVNGVTNNNNSNIKESMFSNGNNNITDVTEEDILERSMKKRRELERTVLAPAFDDKGDNLLHHGKPLTNTKRAEQNRAAQRAFRMRRKTKIQELEEFEKDHRDCDAKMEAMRQEIERLKSYIREMPNNILGSSNNTNDGNN